MRKYTNVRIIRITRSCLLYTSMSLYTSEWNSIVRNAYSQVIQARDLAPQDAVKDLAKEAEALFPAK